MGRQVAGCTFYNVGHIRGTRYGCLILCPAASFSWGLTSSASTSPTLKSFSESDAVIHTHNPSTWDLRYMSLRIAWATALPGLKTNPHSLCLVRRWQLDNTKEMRVEKLKDNFRKRGKTVTYDRKNGTVSGVFILLMK